MSCHYQVIITGLMWKRVFSTYMYIGYHFSAVSIKNMPYNGDINCLLKAFVHAPLNISISTFVCDRVVYQNNICLVAPCLISLLARWHGVLLYQLLLFRLMLASMTNCQHVLIYHYMSVFSKTLQIYRPCTVKISVFLLIQLSTFLILLYG